jgi:hypothetical protein
MTIGTYIHVYNTSLPAVYQWINEYYDARESSAAVAVESAPVASNPDPVVWHNPGILDNIDWSVMDIPIAILFTGLFLFVLIIASREGVVVFMNYRDVVLSTVMYIPVGLVTGLVFNGNLLGAILGVVLVVAWSCRQSIKQNSSLAMGIAIGIGRLTVAPTILLLMLGAIGNLRKSFDKKGESVIGRSATQLASDLGRSVYQTARDGKDNSKRAEGQGIMVAALIFAAVSGFCWWVVRRVVKVRKWK